MMHPFANVGGLFDEDLESWQGQFGCSIESLRVLRDRRAAGLRARAPSGASRPPSARSTRRCPAAPGRRSGARTTTSTSARTWAAARTGASSARTCPTRRTRSPCRRPSPTRRASPRRRSTTGSPRTRGGCSTSTSRWRPQSLKEAGAYTVEVDRLMRYSGWHLLGHRAHGRRPDDLGPRPLEPRPRRPQPVRRRRQQLRDLGRRQPDLLDRRRSRCGPPTTWSRRGSTSRCRRERRPR